jgi:hypothetical protein
MKLLVTKFSPNFCSFHNMLKCLEIWRGISVYELLVFS